jgi:hypothetical protein
MWLVDNETIPHAPTSKFVSKKEYVEIYPEEGHQKRLSYIFKHRIPLQVSAKEGAVLVCKYPSVVECNEWGEEINELMNETLKIKEMAWGDLKSYAVKECGIPFKETTVKRDALEALIINRKFKD